MENKEKLEVIELEEEIEERNNNDLLIIDEESIKHLIYELRGQKVMLDYDLARIYGYETKTFNRQVKNNIDKFPEDFMFQISKEESEFLSRCKNFTAIQTKGIKGGRTSLPYAFTEQGIYMLMTVLKGEIATKQSIALIRLFKRMKDVLVENSHLLVNSNSYIESKFSSYDKRFEIVEAKLEKVMDNFIEPAKYKQFVLLNGQKIEADIAYKQIYSLAKQSILLIDDYIDTRTLRLLKICEKGILITICSDNKAKDRINNGDINDFMCDTGNDITLISNNNKFHDRHIIIDYKTDNEIIYLCGGSSKDAGTSITTIVEIKDKADYYPLFDSLFH